MAFADTQHLVVQLDLKGNLNAKLGEAARAIKGFDRATSNTQQSLSRFGRNLERGIAVGAAAAVGGFVAVAKAAGDFEAQMNTIATIVDRKDIARIGDQLRKTARDTGVSLEDLTSAYYDLASAGVKGELATEALNDAVKLGIGGLATTAETVDLLTTAINAYHLDAAGAAKATDQFALAVQDGKVKASEIAASFADVAAVAKTYKVGIDQIAASYAFLTAQGVPAGEVTTEMQRAIVSLINPTKDLEDAQKKLGVSFTKEIATKGLVGALQELRVYSDKTGIPLIALLGRIEAVKYTLQTTGPNFQGFNAELAKMGNASGTAAKQMAERQQGLNYQLNRLKALVKDAGITIGTALLPKLTPLVAKLNELISANQGRIGEFGQKLADGFTKLADAIGKVDWQPFIDGLKISGDIAKTVIGAFRSLPEDLQKLVIAGFALNKVTGGLGTSIAKDIGGAILNQFAARGASPANPLFVKDVGLPGALGGAGGGTLLGGLLKGLAGLGLVAGGGALLGAGIQSGGPGGAGIGGLGAAGIIGGGALLAGPAGAIVGAIVATGKTLIDIRDLSKHQGDDIAASIQTQISGGAKLADLQTSLAAVNTGINEIQANPLNVLLAGDALDQLRAQKALLEKQIAESQRGTTAIVNAATGFTTGLAKFTPGKQKDDIVNLAQLQKSALLFLHDQFRQMLAGIKKASSPEQIRAVIAAIEKNVFERGKGGVGGAKDVIAGLKGLLLRTDDPKSRQAISAEIRRMERQLNYRTIVAAQLRKADQIYHSSESTKKKIEDLKGIQKHLSAKDLAAQHAVQAKIDALKRADVYAQRATTEAIKDKDLSVKVTVPVTNIQHINGRDITSTQKTISKYFAVAS